MSESGKVKGANNVKAFDEFVNKHNQKNDWYKYVNSTKKKINRELVCKECCFGKSALVQNPTLKSKFEDLRCNLEQKGILITKSSQQLDFGYPDQEVFIKTYEERIIQFKDNVNKIKKLIDEYSQKLELFD